MKSSTLLRAWIIALLLCSPVYATPLPKLVDVGADKCIPCVKMAPILYNLREDFAGQLEVVFVDAWKDRQQAAEYAVRLIPTQIFYSEDGTELYRHSGFFGRQDILNKWQELGYIFSGKEE